MAKNVDHITVTLGMSSNTSGLQLPTFKIRIILVTTSQDYCEG